MNILQRNATSPFGRLDVRLKMVTGFCMSIIAVLGDSLTMLAAVAIVGLAIFLSIRPTRGQAKLVLISCGLLMWGMMFSQGLFYNDFPRQALIEILAPRAWLPDGLRLYREGLHHGLVQSLRMIALGATGYAVCFSTDPDRFLRGLLAMRMPFSLAFMAVSAIRFLPIFAGEFQTVRRAMRMKGYRPLGRGLRDTIRTEVSSLRPVLLGVIRRSQEVALSIQVRGFAIGARRTSLRETRFGAGSWVFAMGMLVITGVLAGVKVLFWLYQYQLYYSPGLRPLYAFVRHWM